ncbi:hypothetical protein B0H17DRAFT_1208175 [Mycena rosella]|uniref:Uncharacterized protein n=1 Tax=Mycena rosella TaxID=1033263 RepID=A0AAD7D197_MYCRO|nr:hypothetical protein B0H17DRAFT_1208175 [Mycena rosella]
MSLIIFLPRYRPWLPGAKPLYRRWIDGEAHVTENEYSESGSEGDDAEMQMQQRDTEDLDMPPILAGHEERLRADTPYRVLSELLRPASLAPVAGPSSARLSKFLDIHTFDDNEDEASDDKEEVQVNEEDLDFTDDEPDARQEATLLVPLPDEDLGKLAELAARYKEAGADYAVSALLEDADTPEVTQKASLLAQDMVVGCVVTDEARDILPRPVLALPAQVHGLLVPQLPILASGLPETTAQVTWRVRRLPMPSEQKKRGEPKQRREYMEPGTWIILKSKHAGHLHSR